MKIMNTKDALKKAMKENDYSYDIYFRMAVIDEYYKGNEDIWNLYAKMQYIRCSNNNQIPREMIDHKQEFIELIKNMKNNGFDYNYPILINQNGLIIDGAHRMACALYYDFPKISVCMHKDYIDFEPEKYGKEWFKQNDLLECIPYAEKQKQLLRRKQYVQE